MIENSQVEPNLKVFNLQSTPGSDYKGMSWKKISKGDIQYDWTGQQ